MANNPSSVELANWLRANGPQKIDKPKTETKLTGSGNKRPRDEKVDVLDNRSPNLSLRRSPVKKKKKLFGWSLEGVGKEGKVKVTEVVDLTLISDDDEVNLKEKMWSEVENVRDQFADTTRAQEKKRSRHGKVKTEIPPSSYRDLHAVTKSGPLLGPQIKSTNRKANMFRGTTWTQPSSQSRLQADEWAYDAPRKTQRHKTDTSSSFFAPRSKSGFELLDQVRRGAEAEKFRHARRKDSIPIDDSDDDDSHDSDDEEFFQTRLFKEHDSYPNRITNSYANPANPAPPKAKGKKVVIEPELCAEQQALVNLILSGQNVFYTGSAGCGKSTVLKAFVKELKNRGQNVVIVAPTGKAALEVNGCTLYTFAGWTPDHFKKPIADLRKACHGKFVRKRMKDVDVLVIDEISMVENHAFERLNEVMQEARGKHDAFGGVQLVVTGDFCQLPPVKPFRYCMECGRETQQKVRDTVYLCRSHGEFHEADKWAFRARGWRQAEFEHVNLTTIHRQSDRKFINILEKCRMGKVLTDADTNLLLNHECNVENAVRLFSTRDEVRRVNTTEFNKLISQKRVFRCYDQFSQQPHHPNLQWKSARLADGSLACLREHKFEPLIELKEGMLVILQVNLNIEEGLVNGSQGVIVGWESYDPAKMPKHIDRDAKSTAVQPIHPLFGDHAILREGCVKTFIEQADVKEWPIVDFDNGVRKTIFADCIVNELGDELPYSILTRTQIPLLAGWAMTVHKSQGMTLSRVIVDLSKSFEEGQTYVALSRARSLAGLKVEGLGRFRGGGNEQVKTFLGERFGIGLDK